MVVGRVAYKGDINDEVPMNRFVTIYFPSDETFWDLNMWGREGKSIYKIPDPPLSLGAIRDPRGRLDQGVAGG